MNVRETKRNLYKRLNDSAEANGVVFFGSDCFAGVPFGELSRDFCVDTPVYNRSIRGLSVYDAEKLLPECVYQLKPAKVFVNLGDADLANADFDLDRFLAAYEWLLYTLHAHCKSQIYTVSVLSGHPMAARANEGIKQIAKSAGCAFLDISDALNSDCQEVQVFQHIRHHLRTHAIDFAEAFQIASAAQ